MAMIDVSFSLYDTMIYGGLNIVCRISFIYSHLLRMRLQQSAACRGLTRT
jgi:hypothetical protein